MAQPPATAAVGALSMSPPGGAAAGMGAADPTADASGGTDSGSDMTVVTICKSDDGSYTVYAGDAPDADSGSDMSDDDAGAMGSAGAAPASGSSDQQGQHADSIGAALKIALDLLQADASSQGAPGSADDQFAAGFSADKSPTPASGPSQKY